DFVGSSWVARLKSARSMPMKRLTRTGLCAGTTRVPARPEEILPTTAIRKLSEGKAMKFTLGKQLGLGFACVLALTVLSAVLTHVKASAIGETQDRAMSVRVPTIAACKDLQRDLNQTQSMARQVILAGNQSARWEAAKKTFDSNWDDVGKDVARLDELSSQGMLQANRDRLVETKQELPSLREFQEAAMKHAAGSERGSTVKAGNEFSDTASPVNEAIKKPLGEMADSFDKLLQQSRDDMSAENRSLELTTAIVTLLALANGIF